VRNVRRVVFRFLVQCVIEFVERADALTAARIGQSPSSTNPADVADATWDPRVATHDYVRHGTTTLFPALEVAPARSPD